MPDRHTRDELEHLQRKKPLTTSNIANVLRRDPNEDPNTLAKRGKGLYDKSPVIMQTKRLRKPSAAIAMHREQVQKNEASRKKRAEKRFQSQCGKQSASASAGKDARPARARRKRTVVLSSDSENDEHDNNLAPRSLSKKSHATVADNLRSEELVEMEEDLHSNNDQEDYEDGQADEDDEGQGLRLGDSDLSDDDSDDGSDVLATPHTTTEVTVSQASISARPKTRKDARRTFIETRNVQKLRTKRRAGSSSSTLPPPSSILPSSAVQQARERAPAPISQPAAAKSASSVVRTHLNPAVGSQSQKQPKKRARVAKESDSDEDLHATSDQTEAAQPRIKRRKRLTKLKLEDFDYEVQRVLLRAVKEYTVRLATVNAFPGDDENLEFQYASWEAAAAYLEVEQEVEVTEDCLRYIAARVSMFRGVIKTSAKSHARTTFGFQSSMSEKIKQANRDLASTLMTDYLFTYEIRDVNNKSNLFGNYMIVMVLAEALFKDKKSLAFNFPDAFAKPPLPLVALIVTVMECCIDEFGSGLYQPRSFTKSLYGSRYVEHLESLMEWEKLVPNRVLLFQESLGMAARDEFGVKTVATAPSTQSRIPLEDINEDNNRFFSKNQNMEREEHGSNTDKEQDDNE